MKTLLLCTTLILAAAPAAFADYGAQPSKAATVSPDKLRVVRITEAPRTQQPASCETATWPNIPASCLQREERLETAVSTIAK